MAFEADCDSSTVLEAIYVASTSRSAVPEGCRVTCGLRDEALRDSATPTQASRQDSEAAGRQIRNSKFEIRNCIPLACGSTANRLPFGLAAFLRPWETA